MMGWSRPRPAAAALMWALAAALVAPGRAADAPPPQPEAAPGGEAKADRAALLALPGEEPPQPFIPLHPRTVADRQQVEALSEYCAARALEERRAWTEAIDL